MLIHSPFLGTVQLGILQHFTGGLDVPWPPVSFEDYHIFPNIFTHTHTHTHTVTHTTTTVLRRLSGTTRVSQYQKKHSPTHHLRNLISRMKPIEYHLDIFMVSVLLMGAWSWNGSTQPPMLVDTGIIWHGDICPKPYARFCHNLPTHLA